MISRPTQAVRLLCLAVSICTLAACSSSSNPVNSAPIPCNVGTLVQLAAPLPGQTGVSTTMGTITLVADGSTNTLYATHSQWIILMTDSSGQPWTGGSLQLVADPSGPHPYPSDFFYASSFPRLISGRTYSASLSEPNGSCLPVPLGSFST